MSRHVVEDYLLDHRLALVAAIGAVIGFNALLGLEGQRAFARQELVKRQDYLPPGVVGLAKSVQAQVLLPLVGAVIFVGISWWFDRELFGIIAGGFLVMQLASTGTALITLLSTRALSDPSAAAGQITYSAVYRYRSWAAQLIAFSAFSWVAFFLRGGPMLFGGAVFLLAGAAGAYRRARQAKRSAVVHQDAA